MESNYVSVSVNLLILLTLAAGKPFQKGCSVVPGKTAGWKVVNGKNVDLFSSLHPHPYIVSLQWKASNLGYEHFCGGAILDRWTIITAAHCFYDQEPNCWGRDPTCFRIVAGMYDLSSQPDPGREQVSEFSSNAIKPHEDFNESRHDYDNDIALIHLEKPLNCSSYVEPIKLVNADKPYSRSNAMISGWGVSETSDKHYTPFLKEALVSIHSQDDCSDLWKDEFNPKSMICASGGSDWNRNTPHSVADACNGDSGGPLVAKDIKINVSYLVGLVSWGRGCGINNFPGVYTNLVKYVPWIEQNLKTNTLTNHRRRSACSATIRELENEIDNSSWNEEDDN